ncbi:hypothetical protein Tco_0639900 [Tanacetum coccineum]
MPNPEVISNPTTTMNMTLVLIAKAFKLNQSTLTNNNQRISSNPRNKQIVQPDMNMRQDRQIQMIGSRGGNQFGQNRVILNAVQNSGVHNVGNQNGLIVVLGIAPPIANQNGNGNVVTARAKTQLLIAQKEDAGLQLQTGEYDLMDAAGDIAEIENVEQSGGTVQQHLATVEETRAHYESLFNNLAVEVEKVNMVNHKLKEADDSLDKIKALEFEIKRLLRAVISQDIMSIVQNTTVVETSDLLTELEPWVVVTGVRGVRGVRLVLFSIGGDVHVGGVFRTWHRLCVSGGGLRRLLRWTTLGSGNNGLWVALPGLGWGGLVEGVCRRGLLCSAHERWKLFTFQDGGFIVGTLKFRRGRHGVPSWVTSRGLVVQVVKYAARGVTLSGVAQVLGFSEDGRTKSSRCLIERAKLPIVASGCDEALLEWLAEM